jgi:PAS domain S-box-containing protein
VSDNDMGQRATELRLRAEENLRQTAQLPEALVALPTEETRRTLHELRVHQIELEMQNTELRRAQTDLEYERQRYFDLYEMAPVGYCTVSEEGLITRANLSAGDLLGITRDARAGRPIFSRFILEEDQDIYYRQRKKVMATAATERCELRMVKKDGSGFWAHLEISLGRDVGDSTVYRIVLSDISTRKQAEEVVLLRQSEEKYRALVEHSSDPIFSFNVDLTYRFVNEAFARPFGKAPAEIIDQSPHAIFTDDEAEKHLALICQVFQTGQKKDAEVKVVAQSGEVRDYWTLADPIKNAEGQVLFVTCIAKDITERKRTEEEKAKLELLNRQLQKNESLGRMAGAIAHHFNNKLQAVMGCLELVIFEMPQGGRTIDKLNAAMQAAEQAAEVSRKMLTYLGQVTGKQESLDLSEFCKIWLPMLHNAMPKNVDLATDFPSPGPIIKANAEQVLQIVTNLVTNGWEALDDQRGTLALIVSTVSPADISKAHRFPVNWQAGDGAYACLEVRDSGCGIAAEDLEEVFAPFFSTKFAGRGLGLPVVAGLVQAHNGVVTVESSGGRGSVFRVFFPILTEEVCRLPDTTAKIWERERGGTVLLVDDDKIVLSITGMLLAELGFTVLFAGDGLEALEIFLQHKDEIRFVLSDVSMPRMNGWEVLTALRHITPGLPVILTSGYTEEEVMEDDRPDRPKAFLAKPYELEELEIAICRALGPI